MINLSFADLALEPIVFNYFEDRIEVIMQFKFNTNTFLDPKNTLSCQCADRTQNGPTSAN